VFHEYFRMMLETDTEEPMSLPTLSHRETTIQRDNWMEIARQHCQNEQYYRGLLDQIGEILGPEAYISDDGSVQQDVVRAKLPELVRRRLKG
jgi:hypothetical protein